MKNPGGLTNTKYVDEPVKEILKQIHSQINNNTNINYDKLNIHSYKTQVVAGLIYYIKVNIDDNKYAHLKVIEYLPHVNKSPELLSHQLDKKIDDEIEYF